MFPCILERNVIVLQVCIYTLAHWPWLTGISALLVNGKGHVWLVIFHTFPSCHPHVIEVRPRLIWCILSLFLVVNKENANLLIDFDD